ncbi:hypothetical protein EN871_11670 [bacterium M00.F.Ca.ET.228.01.1.1]|uniref:M23 family metallopeptidase n=2 Tax=Pseudomonadota TaxID=1224 RepID=UPI0010922310|nr:M23 family metallopeptidase [Paraburkholderia phenoliruptrix]TGP43700.1 hypothetical protein EN871_11670 [bacterium M00.F.Ca.ET.228.01.1.1]TGS01362.1 hypothetical protein EN834_11665 [bacterium M00.F.Ca.ET.191.01.1.1]TGU09032.1 hypothetical protein EN798_07865 [bacterium M00.F.Ca.ET.155.01.1.1]MBW0449425.1 hypothetical protein [Paraburkholderia phenoliruptrix]MBW9097706.1 hypothetical protein [Paraburkholderia phenoliruptrix]
MIISPPFLPAAGATSSNADAPDPMMDAVDQFELAHGIYPIAFDRRWHTGVHLMPATQNERVRAIADGEVVAYRVAQQAIDGGEGTLDSNTGFVLLKHTTETGDGRSITFYSLYMHLLELDAYAGLGVQVNSLPEFLRTPTPEDGQSGGGKKVYRKDVLGLPGRCHGQRHIHFEIFMLPDDFNAHFRSTQLDNKQPATPTHKDCWGHTYYIVPAGQTFLAKPTGTDSHNKLHGVAITPLQSGSNVGYALYVETWFHRGSKYTNTWKANQDGSQSLLTPQPVKETGYEYDMFERATKLYKPCPSDGYDLLRFGRILSDDETLPEDGRNLWMRVTYAPGCEGYLDMLRGDVVKLSDADFPFFKGWQKISESNPLYSDDGMCDIDEFKQIVGHAEGASTGAKEYADEDALSNYIKGDDAIRAKLKTFICEAPSEWDGPHNESRYSRLNASDGFYGKQNQTNPNGYSDFLALLKKFQFWDKTGLPQGKLWFFHPLQFVRHFRRCGWLSQGELAQVYAESNYTHVGKTGAEYKDRYRLSINKVFRKYGLNKPVRMSHFFGQSAIESYYMMVVRECSVAIGHAISTNHISIMPETDGYLRSPPAPAAAVAYFNMYEGNTNLGNTDAGDGVKFRGRGFKQLTGRYNYSQYWEFRGWSVGGPYNHQWFTHLVNGHYLPGPVIEHPELAGNDAFTCVDTGGFFWARYRVARAADAGVNETASNAVASIVNHYDQQSPPLRWREAQNAFKVLGE